MGAIGMTIIHNETYAEFLLFLASVFWLATGTVPVAHTEN